MVRPVLSPAERDLKRLIEASDVATRYGMSTGASAAVNDAALEAALTASADNSGVLVIPAGVYEVSSPYVSGLSGFKIVGYGATLQVVSASTDPALYLDSCTDFTVEGLSFEYASLASRSAASYGIRTDDCSDFNIIYCHVLSSRGVGIGCRGASRYVVHGNVIEGTLADGIYNRDSSNNGIISGNLLDGTGDDSITLASYISDGSPGITDVTVTGNIVLSSSSRGVICNGGKRVTISGNTIRGSTNHGVLLISESSFGGFYAVEDVTVANNVVTSCGSSTSQHGIYVSGRSAQPTVRCSVTNNVVSASGGDGIRVASSDTAAGVSGVNVSGNLVSTSGKSGLNGQVCTKLRVRANVFRDCEEYGVYVETSTSGVPEVVGNRVEDCNQSAGGSIDGINVRSSEAVVANNTVLDTAGNYERDLEAHLVTSGRIEGNYLEQGGDGFLHANMNGSWTAWSPTFTGITAGNGTVSARYRIDGRTLHWHYQIVLGSTSAVGTNPKLSTPSGWKVYNAGNTVQTYALGKAFAYDSSAGTFFEGGCYGSDATDNVLTTRIIFGSTTVTAAAPFTWASGDILVVSGTCEVEPA